MKIFNNFLFDDTNQQTPTVLVCQQPPVLVPTEVFQLEKKLEYLSLYMDLDEFSEVFYEEIGEYQGLYALSQQDLFNLKREYPQLSVRHLSLYAYQQFHQRGLTSFDNTLALLLHGDTADFWLERECKLQLLNQFRFPTDTDGLYLAMNLLVQCHIDFSDGNILLCDLSKEHAALIELMKQYLPSTD